MTSLGPTFFDSDLLQCRDPDTVIEYQLHDDFQFVDAHTGCSGMVFILAEQSACFAVMICALTAIGYSQTRLIEQ